MDLLDLVEEGAYFEMKGQTSYDLFARRVSSNSYAVSLSLSPWPPDRRITANLVNRTDVRQRAKAKKEDGAWGESCTYIFRDEVRCNEYEVDSVSMFFSLQQTVRSL